MSDEHAGKPSVQVQGRGKLKIFLGAVAGVGKTYRMLAEAQRRLLRGEDVVVGLVETHGRPVTAQLLEGLEQIPLKKLEYRGVTFFELDTAAVIERRPEWVLVDELAHTNVPGTVHAKRWQSIEEIRNAGINVISTLNIQHLESLNDAVYEITHVRVRETVPDWVVDSADEIELADLTPDALLNRLKRGDIYASERIPLALQNFFKKGNIVALRELALRTTAAEVDDQLQVLSPTPATSPVKAVHDRVVALYLAARRVIQAGAARLPVGQAYPRRLRLPAREKSREAGQWRRGDAAARDLRPGPRPRWPSRRTERRFYCRADHQVCKREPDHDDRNGAVGGGQMGGDPARFARHPPDARDEEHRYRGGRRLGRRALRFSTGRGRVPSGLLNSASTPPLSPDRARRGIPPGHRATLAHLIRLSLAPRRWPVPGDRLLLLSMTAGMRFDIEQMLSAPGRLFAPR